MAQNREIIYWCMKITPSEVRTLCELALIIEPILDKEGCTTRYRDLDEKPLADFLTAGINAGPVLEDYARSVIEDGNEQIFSHFPAAIQVSNNFKRKKYINTGLLHFLFLTIRVRLESETLEEALDNYIPITKRSSKADILSMLEGFELGWSTSSKKRTWQQEKQFRNALTADSYYERQRIINSQNQDKTSSQYQTTKEALDGFPTIRRYVTEVDDKKGIIESFEHSYRCMHEENPDTKVGILADLSASALFLYLSYQDKESYEIF